MAVGVHQFRLSFQNKRTLLRADPKEVAFALIVQLGDERGAFPRLHAGDDRGRPAGDPADVVAPRVLVQRGIAAPRPERPVKQPVWTQADG